MERTLHLEKSVNQSLLNFTNWPLTKPPKLVKFIIELGDHVTNLCKMEAPKFGKTEYLFDRHTLGDSDNKN
ncbi:hypothetical protein HPG69_008850 [Diceros bicornis minor]|uniref:Uncharacterized protein n=1 Tax=Diceros bicornis minor TaxID=77932 RepID=A0A7J7FBU1_DICBM|nr:hypothetical protein HPG69_008850 [Diceros bicornis minor]